MNQQFCLTSLLKLSLRKLRMAGLFDPYRACGVVGLGVGLWLALYDRHDAGVTLDEPSEMRYGRWIAAWFASGFRDRRALFRDYSLARYGGMFDALSQIAVHFTPHDPVGTRHAASALCALAGVVATWKMAARLEGEDRRAGLIAAALLAFTPVWVGHGLFNPKDIPFGAAAAWSTWCMLRVATDAALPGYRLSLLFGTALGAALGVRPGGMFLLGYPLLAWSARGALALAERRKQPRSGAWLAWAPLLRAAGWLALCWLTAWLCMLIFWPWAQLDPLSRPLEAARFVAHSRWGGSMLFEGGYVNAQHLPFSYLPVWFAITLPETYAVAALCGGLLLWLRLRPDRHRRARPGALHLSSAPSPAQSPEFAQRRRRLGAGWLCVAAAAFGPVIAQTVTRATIYDAQRHFLFVLPPLAALMGALIARCLFEPQLSPALRAGIAGLLIGTLSAVGVDMWRLHPYEYVYFNRLVGGLPGAATNFETDYWGASYTEGLRWLATRLDPNDRVPVRIATCDHDDSVRLFLQEHPALARRVTVEPRRANADILLAGTRNGCHKTTGNVLHVVQRMGVPFLYVIQRRALVSKGAPLSATADRSTPM